MSKNSNQAQQIKSKERVLELYKSYGQKENISFILDTQIFQGSSLAIMNLLEKDKVNVISWKE